MQFARSIVNALEDKKAENIILMDIRGLAVFADFFVICSGTSERMLQALADAVNEHVHQVYSLPIHTEGRSQDGWLLVDFNGYSLGWGKCTSGRVNNHYPRGLRTPAT